MSAPSDQPPGSGDTARLEKLMSLSRYEFELSIARVGPSVRVDDLTYRFAVGAGTVDVNYASLPGVTFGGALTLPRATVALVFRGVEAGARAGFVTHFDNTFRRGGG